MGWGFSMLASNYSCDVLMVLLCSAKGVNIVPRDRPSTPFVLSGDPFRHKPPWNTGIVHGAAVVVPLTWLCV